jgi:hypothetical protein
MDRPRPGKIRLRDYAESWIADRPGLRPRTVHLYGWLLAKYVTPHLGNVQLGQLDTPMIRQWRAKLLREGLSELMTAKAYRLLRAVLMTAANEDREHATSEADQEIARALSGLVAKECVAKSPEQSRDDGDEGQAGVLAPVG